MTSLSAGARRLAELVAAEGRACVVVVNKWDAVADKQTNTLRDFEEDLRAQLRPIQWASVVFTSARTGQRVTRVLEAVHGAAAQHRWAWPLAPPSCSRKLPSWLRRIPCALTMRTVKPLLFFSCRRRISTATLNMVLREAVSWRSPPSRKGDTRKGRVYYGTQVHYGQAIPTSLATASDVNPDASHGIIDSIMYAVS